MPPEQAVRFLITGPWEMLGKSWVLWAMRAFIQKVRIIYFVRRWRDFIDATLNVEWASIRAILGGSIETVNSRLPVCLLRIYPYTLFISCDSTTPPVTIVLVV